MDDQIKRLAQRLDELRHQLDATEKHIVELNKEMDHNLIAFTTVVCVVVCVILLYVVVI